MSEESNGTSYRPGLVQAGRNIEEESFRIIEAEMGPHSFDPEAWSIVRRIIHTTGDFEYAQLIRIHPEAVSAAVRALRGGAAIYVDTRMIQVGLSPWRLQWFGNPVFTPAADPETHLMAEKLGLTRSVAAFRKMGERLTGNIVAVGNAPTALLEVLRLWREDGVRPALVIGVPVGFVQADTAKDALWEADRIPSITVKGRKGGSTVAVAVLHALLELAQKESR
ncbi:precorrin-8X methylmutase [Desulfacinum infernum DSM 9756]|uniref:Precorrin-8X methylmutase n=1 Tax=Desulfacinum infernum DSM 9756 TaxID=1121391 RepID=A0A1M5E8W0_9BACT|nr:precorrin-8X methylmutase [Desulfacinum infernum]SHF75636.1 precorrin-8X methylmutase [Desulfacinum infernum DSM 9756]